MQKKYYKAWKNVKRLALNSDYSKFGDKNRNIKDVLLVEQLVDKEIPKKPRYARTIYIEYFEDEEGEYECPNCGKCYRMPGEYLKYCSNCGQHLDWSDNDGKILY